jgi:hypothetical protein
MCDRESGHAEKGAGRQRTRSERIAHALIVALPFLVPVVIVAFAQAYLALSAATPGYLEGLEASYPAAYVAVAPDSGRLRAQAAEEEASVHILSGSRVVVSYLTDFRARLVWLTASVTVVIVLA